MLKWLSALLCVLLAYQPAFADDRARLLGIWKLVSFDVERQDTAERSAAYGKNPTGYLIFTPEGRMMAVLEGEGRKAPQTDEDRVALFRNMFAYTGTYRLEGDKWITKVDVSWNPAWNGTDQARFYKLEGDRLHVISAWAPSPNLPGRPMVRGITTWEKSK